MTARRRRSRRRWSLSRLHRRALQHRASIVRAVAGVALLAAVWWLWPGPQEFAVDRHDQWDERAEGLKAVSIAVSAKGQIAGHAMAGRERVEARLPQVASATAVVEPPETGAAGAGEVARPAPRRADPSDPLLEAPERAIAPTTGAVPITPGLIVEPSVTVLAEPAAGPAVDVVRADRPGADALKRPRTSESAGANPILRAAAAATTASEPALRRPDATRPQHAAASVAAALGSRARRPPTWLQNAVAPAIYDRPMIAVVIDDLGENRTGTAALNHLPAPLTLAFLPYASKLDEQTRAARAAGHELLVHVPMEPTGGEWPGPSALTSQLGPAELTSRLRAHLRSFRGFVGINNHMGSRLTADPERMDLVMAELREHDLLFLDSRTSARSVAGREAHRLGVPYAERDVFLDNELELGSVRRQLAAVETIARRRGYAVAIGHPHQVTIEALRRWLPTLDARGLALAPISAIVARRYCAEDAPASADACTQYIALASLIE